MSGKDEGLQWAAAERKTLAAVFCFMAGGRGKRNPQELRDRRGNLLKTADEMRAIRNQWEIAPPSVCSFKSLCREHGLSFGTITKRAAAEGWKKHSQLVHDTRAALMKATGPIIAANVEKAAEKVAKSLLADLQPLIEKEKRAQILRALRRSKKGQRRLDELVQRGIETINSKTGNIETLKLSARDEMSLATAEEKFDSIIRRNLGMSENAAPIGALSVRVLTGQVAVAVDTQRE